MSLPKFVQLMAVGSFQAFALDEFGKVWHYVPRPDGDGEKTYWKMIDSEGPPVAERLP